MRSFLLCADLFIFCTVYGGTIDVDSFPPCGNNDWTAYEDEKCFRVFPNKFETRHEAEKTCKQEHLKTDISIPTLVSIKSAAEQEFLTKLVFDQFGVGDNVWTGAKRRTGNDSQFVWNDDSDINFTNWAEGSPSEQIQSDCVRMKSKWSNHNYKISIFDERWSNGKWVNVPCNKTRSVVLCQKLQTWSFRQLQKTLLDTRHELTNTRNHLDNTENQLKNTINKLDNTENQLKNTINKLNNTENQLKNTINKLDNTENQLKNTINKLDNTENQLKNTINQLDNTRFGLENTKNQLDKARNEFIDLRALTISGEFHGKIFLHPKAASERFGNFYKSQLICQKYNATTVKIHSAQENDFLWVFLKDYMNPNYAWLGGTIYVTSDGLTWLDNSRVNYLKFRSGEPDYKDQTCMIISGHDGYWDNIHCSRTDFSVICEKVV